MRMTGMDLGAALLAALLVAGAAVGGVSVALGAHPWWAVKTGVVGALLGFAVYAALRLWRVSRVRTLLVGVLIFALGWAAAYFGKQEFVGSHARNGLAGQFWFLGWFAVSAGASAALAGAFACIRR